MTQWELAAGALPAIVAFDTRACRDWHSTTQNAPERAFRRCIHPLTQEQITG